MAVRLLQAQEIEINFQIINNSGGLELVETNLRESEQCVLTKRLNPHGVTKDMHLDTFV